MTTQAPLRQEEVLRRAGRTIPVLAVADQAKELESTDALERAIAIFQEQGLAGSDELMSMLRNTRRQPGGGGVKGATTSSGPFDGDCFYCKVKGHRKSACEKLNADKAKGIWAPAGQEPRPWVQPTKGAGKGDGKGGGKGNFGKRGRRPT